ncbi:MAG: hypothetical protein Kow0069_37910 [Promethearchaeota archaeon]
MPAIRSLTLGIPRSTRKEQLESYFARLVELADATKSAGFEVQTTRVALERETLSLKVPLGPPTLVVDALGDAGVDYLAWPQAVDSSTRSKHLDSLASAIRDVLWSDSRFFSSIPIAGSGNPGVDHLAIELAARVVTLLGSSRKRALSNLQFCSSANVPPNVPFFPAAYHVPSRERVVLSVATQTADLAVEAAREALEGAEFTSSFVEKVTNFLERAWSALKGNSAGDWDLTGFDLSPAPFPREDSSIGRALELLSGEPVGRVTTCGAVALVTTTLGNLGGGLDCVGPGFHGVMLPVLEDAVLAKRAAEGRLTLQKILLYSTLCGTGVDTLPIPGDSSNHDVACTLRALATLSIRHSKPLTARLMPVKGAEAGDPVDFGFEYFAPGAVVPLD